MLISSHFHLIISEEDDSKIIYPRKGSFCLTHNQPPKLGSHWAILSRSSSKRAPYACLSNLLPKMQTKGQQFIILFSASPLNFGSLVSITLGGPIFSSFMNLVHLIDYNITIHILFRHILLTFNCRCILCYKFASN